MGRPVGVAGPSDVVLVHARGVQLVYRGSCERFGASADVRARRGRMEEPVQVHAAALAIQGVEGALPLMPPGTPGAGQAALARERSPGGFPRLAYRSRDELMELLVGQLGPSHADDPSPRGQVPGQVQLKQRG